MNKRDSITVLLMTFYIKGGLVTEAPNVANPLAHALESLVNKLDDSRQESDAQGKFVNIAASMDVSRIDNGAVSLPLQPPIQMSRLPTFKLHQKMMLNELTRFILYKRSLIRLRIILN